MRPQSRPQLIDRASLTRQFLAAAVDRAVDAGLPVLAHVDAGFTFAREREKRTQTPASRREQHSTVAVRHGQQVIKHRTAAAAARR